MLSLMSILDTIRSRYSCRSYKPESVPREQIEQCLEAARLAPSACNKQPWRFKVVIDQTQRRNIVENGFLGGLPMLWALDAPVFIVIGMIRSVVTHRIAPQLSGVDYPWVDIGIAGEHLVLQATELGLGTCWIGWIRPKRIRTMLGWSKSTRPVAVITLGLPAEAPSETQRRPRKGLNEISEWL